jgi:AbrB family looped-hinge helix DNA binding protein
MRVTVKGQVTIPIAIREKLGIYPECEVEFELDGDRAILRKADHQHVRGKRLVEHLRGRATAGLSTDEILAHTRGEEA